MNKLIVPIILSTLSGCTTISNIDGYFVNSQTKYKEPIHGKTAQVRVFYGVGESIKIYPNSANKKEIKNDVDGGVAFTKRIRTGLMSVEYEPKSLGMPHKPNTSHFGEFKVPADKPIIIVMSYSLNDSVRYSSCPTKYFQTTFEENKNYAVLMNISGSSCEYEFYEYTDTGSIKMNNVKTL